MVPAYLDKFPYIFHPEPADYEIKSRTLPMLGQYDPSFIEEGWVVLVNGRIHGLQLRHQPERKAVETFGLCSCSVEPGFSCELLLPISASYLAVTEDNACR